MSSRLRSAGPSVLATCLTLTLASGLVRADPSGGAGAFTAAVAWPPSTTVLLSEVMTGGASASDEFIELYDAGSAPVDLGGDEVVYVTATGGTVTRKAAWTTPAPLLPGQHLLVANAAGAFASGADARYSGGLAAAGGAVALRAADGSVIDSIAWGTAASGFVEGSPAPAPPAGSSLERLPGGASGNGIDTNDDSLDWFVPPSPDPQALADPPVPSSPGATPTPTLTLPPTSEPTPTDTAPTPTATTTDTPGITAVPAPTSAPPLTTPSGSPTVLPTQAAPSSTPTTPAPPATVSIAAARGKPAGTAVVVQGVLTTPLGLTDAGHGAFVQDASAGIAVYLTGDGWPALAIGTGVRVSGTTDSRYGQATIRVADPGQLVAVEGTTPPSPLTVATGEAGEGAEGLLVTTGGTVTDAPQTLSDGFAVTVDDGSGALRVVAGAASGVSRDALRRDATVALTGVLGQHASSGSTGGYRLYPRSAGDVAAVGPSPSPSPSAPAVSPIGTLAHLGQHAVIEGTVTSSGLLWGADDRRFTIQDASGAILVRVPTAMRPPAVGRAVRVAGTVGHYLGAPEFAADGAPVALPTVVWPVVRPIGHAPLSAALRWHLVVAVGTVTELRRSSASWRCQLRLSDGSHLPIGAGLAAGVLASRVAVGTRVAVTGIVRPPATGSSDQQLYEMVRGPADVVVLARPAAVATGGGAGAEVSGTPPPDEPLDVDLADLGGLVGRIVRVGGIIVNDDGHQLILDDGTAQAVVRLPAPSTASAALTPGTAVTLVGTVVAGPEGTAELQLRVMADLALAGDPQLGPAASPAASDVPTATPAASMAATAALAQADPGAPPASTIALLGTVALSCLVLAGLAARIARRRVDGPCRRRIRDRLVALRTQAPQGPPAPPAGP